MSAISGSEVLVRFIRRRKSRRFLQEWFSHPRISVDEIFRKLFKIHTYADHPTEVIANQKIGVTVGALSGDDRRSAIGEVSIYLYSTVGCVVTVPHLPRFLPVMEAAQSVVINVGFFI